MDRPVPAAFALLRRGGFGRSAARGGPAFGFGTRGGGAQVGEQAFQRTGVLAQGLFLGRAVLVALVQVGNQARARLAVLFQLHDRVALLRARGLELGAPCDDLLFHLLERRQIGGQRVDTARLVALHVAMVGQQAVRIGHAVLRQQYLQRCVAALLVGRTHQRAQLRALPLPLRLQRVAPLLQLGQRRGFAAHGGLRLGQRTRRAADLLVGLAQLAGCRAAFALQLAAFLRDRFQFAAHALQLLLGLARSLRRRSRGERHAGQQDRDAGGAQAMRHQATIRLRPVMSAGCGRPSRSNSVGATSRSAPPLRSVAARSPT